MSCNFVQDCMEEYITGTNQHIKVHNKANCRGYNCVIHNPSDHPMKNFPTNWRGDRYLMERICSHGVGHPDPDDLAFKAILFGKTQSGLNNLNYESVHGCDGCCQDKKVHIDVI